MLTTSGTLTINNYGSTLNDVSGGPGTTIGSPAQYGIDAFTQFSGNISVSTSAGDTITSGGTGILAVNEATAIAASAGSTITVNNSAVVNSGATLDTGGQTAGGIKAGYDGPSGAADLSVYGTVLINNSANVTAPVTSGWGINAFNYGNGNVTVNDLAPMTTVTGPDGIGAYQNSGGTGDVVVAVAADAMIVGTGTGTDPGTTRANGYGIQAISEGTGNISVTTAANDTITSTSDGIEVLNGATAIPEFRRCNYQRNYRDGLRNDQLRFCQRGWRVLARRYFSSL